MNRNPLLVIFLTVFIDLVGFGMIIPLSPFLATNFGADAFQVGLLMAVYSGAQFLFAPLWGQISDRFGRRPVILVSLVGAGLAHILFGLASSLWLLFLARGLAGLCGANISTAMAYIADVTDEKDRSKGMGLVGAAFGLGFVLGPAIGGFFSRFGFSVPAFVAAGICLANAALAFFVLPESLPPERRGKGGVQQIGRFARIQKHFRNPQVSALLAGAFLLSFALSNMEASLFLLVKDRFGWGLDKASFGFAYVGIVMAFTQGFLIRKLLPRFGEESLMLGGSLLFAVGMFTVGVGPAVIWAALGMTALAVGNGLFNPSVQGRVSVLTSPQEQGEVMGVLQSLSALARIFGPPLGGLLYDHSGMSSPFLLATVLACVVAWIVHRFVKKRK
jgi:MFS transporter, DHA1 family, tetracycline resistance protein